MRCVERVTWKLNTVCKIERAGIHCVTWELKQGLCDTLDGWDWEGGFGREEHG